MGTPLPRPYPAQITPDLTGMLALNRSVEEETSALDAPGLRARLTQARFIFLHEAGRGGFVIAFDQDSVVDSPNFRWFAARHPSFIYIDRVAVAATLRGQGIARALYRQVLDAAAANGAPCICAEVNVVPPNPASHALHLAMGFLAQGEATLDNGKTVRYYRRDLP